MTFPVDAHVHFHELSRVAPALDCARSNLAMQVNNSDVIGMLLLTESSSEDVFAHLTHVGAVGSWRIERHRAEGEVCMAFEPAGRALVIVCGRQIRVRRGLEVLALGTTRRFEEGRPLVETLHQVAAAGALPVLPWGFGKWAAGRGKEVRQAILDGCPQDFFLGDNGGRPRLSTKPRLMRLAEQRGFRVLPGSDPFPFADDTTRTGNYGFIADYEPALDRPWQQLKSWLARSANKIEPFGRGETAARFVVNQVRMQLRNRSPLRRAA